MTHEIKSHPQPFESRRAGLKTHEFRKNDRNYAPGDFLHEREYYPPSRDAKTVGYSGRSILSLVTYVGKGPGFGIPKGYCAMSVKTLAMWPA